MAGLGTAPHASPEPGHPPEPGTWTPGAAARFDSRPADRMREAGFLRRAAFPDLSMPLAGVTGRTALPGSTLAEALDLLDRPPDEQLVDAAARFHPPRPAVRHRPGLAAVGRAARPADDGARPPGRAAHQPLPGARRVHHE
ncbi:DUF5937 family protein [Streptomyces sp. NPDC018964]|uniref:DUF5937 family protein n=1 Tax=Streptomyces sp. NPDC018964 TaxID=3365058 RepID=UPI0037972F08